MSSPSDRRRRPGRPRGSSTLSATSPREEILGHASRLFSTQGVGATTMADIARAVGVTPAAVRYHFASLERIIDALLDYVIEETDAFHVTADEVSSADRRLHDLLARHVEHLTSTPYDLWFVVGISVAAAEQHQGFLQHTRAWRHALGMIVEDGRRAGIFAEIDADLAVAALSGLVYSALREHHSGRRIDPETFAGLGVRALSTGG
ncbi:MAG: TetR/AcrR family transcriptional regulator [Actinomycetota bacterium]